MPNAIAQRVHDITDRVHLSQAEVGEIAGASARTVARWSAGEVTPQPAARDRLLELHYVTEQASGVLHDDDINVWLFSPNQMLGGDRPADRIAQGNYREVLALLEALGEGVSF